MRIALVTAQIARPVDEDMPLVCASFAKQGVACDVWDWDDPSVDWAAYHAVVLRSPWDYTYRLADFIAWVRRVASQACLLNPASLVVWNSDKRYLLDVARAGLGVVPTQVIGPGDSFAANALVGESVVKPSVGAGSRGCVRLAAGDAPGVRQAVQDLHAQGYTALVQPYLDRVDSQGETAILCFGGKISHAIRKGALLKVGAPAQRALFAESHIQAITPTQAECALAQQVLKLPQLQGAAYVRVDLIADAQGLPLVHEIEAIEPSLFLDFAQGSAERYVEAVIAALAPQA
jgi:glutathione synthase/RimK-type ligase-like ATP-grasp enzyme